MKSNGKELGVAQLFSVVPKKDHLSLIEGKQPQYKKVVDFLKFKTKDVAHATGVPLASIRFDDKMPAKLAERLYEWAISLNLVAEFFKGDRHKTYLWFTVPNPLLGGVSPKDMIRLGRFRKLYCVIAQALSENRGEA